MLICFSNRRTVNLITLTKKSSHLSGRLPNWIPQGLHAQQLIEYPPLSMKTSASPEITQSPDNQLQPSNMTRTSALGSTWGLCPPQYLSKQRINLLENTQINLQRVLLVMDQTLTPRPALIHRKQSPKHFGLVWIYQNQCELLLQILLLYIDGQLNMSTSSELHLLLTLNQQTVFFMILTYFYTGLLSLSYMYSDTFAVKWKHMTLYNLLFALKRKWCWLKFENKNTLEYNAICMLKFTFMMMLLVQWIILSYIVSRTFCKAGLHFMVYVNVQLSIYTQKRITLTTIHHQKVYTLYTLCVKPVLISFYVWTIHLYCGQPIYLISFCLVVMPLCNKFSLAPSNGHLIPQTPVTFHAACWPNKDFQTVRHISYSVQYEIT